MKQKLRFVLLIILLFLFALPTFAQKDPPQYATDQRIISVAVPRLNVRGEPNTNGVIITVIKLGQRYPVVGRNEDNTWWEIAVRGTTGWVVAHLVVVTNPATIPLTGQVDNASAIAQTQAAVHYVTTTLGVRNNLKIRVGPGIRFRTVGVIPYDQRATILARNVYGTWWLVNYGGIVGWVSGNFVTLPPALNVNAVPIR